MHTPIIQSVCDGELTAMFFAQMILNIGYAVADHSIASLELRSISQFRRIVQKPCIWSPCPAV